MNGTNESPVIEVRGLKKYFSVKKSKLHAVDNVSLSIEAGKTLGVVGESGCGKSTLGRTILRLTEPTDGKIFFRGIDITGYGKLQMRDLRRKMQIIFQDPYSSINPRMTVADIIAQPMIVNKMFNTKKKLYDRIRELMDTVGLAARLYDSYPHELDGGRRQRIGIARALALNPEFIVCDEPVSALDVSIQAQILNLLMDLQDNMGLTYMFITHNLSVVRHISDDIAVMYLGQCIETCKSRELFKNPRHPYTRALLSAIPLPDLSLRGKPRQIIRGEITNPVDPPPGCRFAPRCDFCREACTTADPEFRQIAPDHFVACVAADEITLKQNGEVFAKSINDRK
ncbi:MAG: ATP-binding cassette domain-containing protein [Synergistaceae bacterium]|jgi:peptide/nickel transport system ATP-binding protein|nr:ATP-binding cassette domain-containing protein [Synergistaceae bacterium]